MLVSVHIENIALISKLDIDFNNGFTVFTGETGAGKSILVDSINMVAGARMNKDIIRTGMPGCSVSAVFSELSDKIVNKIEEYGIKIDDDRMLMVQRTLTAEGKSTSKINGRTVPQSVLKDICSGLINIYGQNDFHSLTDPDSHINFVDNYADNTQLISLYNSEYQKLAEIKNRIKVIRDAENTKEQRADFLKYQIQEISSAKLTDGEEETLLNEKTRIQNYERISSSAEKVYMSLYGSEKRSAYNSISTAIDCLDDLSQIVPELKNEQEKLNEFLYEIRDIAEKVISHKPEISDEPTKIIDSIEERLDLIYRLKKKYNLSVDGLKSYLENISSELEDIQLSDQKLKQLNSEFSNQYEKVSKIASQLTEKRKKASAMMEAEIKEQFEFLDMSGVVFKVDFQKIHDDEFENLSSNGADRVEFLISTNAGEPLKPMAKIASGGELSRIMLAIKKVLALNDEIPTIIFDEIDTGISGKTSHKVGINLKKLSKDIQVFCVTHSAQVASLCHNHYKIEKHSDSERTQTNVFLLTEQQREKEIARILGGLNVTDAVIMNARELIEQGKNI
ncbi:MAG: DNA repair protein RecN [Clostridia bacterium]|nr:DNA repair protein RecN [Clostridia bacterium]